MRTAVVLTTGDLRVHDNVALSTAAREGERIVPLFVFDDAILGSAFARPNRVAFLLDALGDLDASLSQCGARLVLRSGDVVGETVGLARKVGAEALFVVEDASGYAQRRQRRLEAACRTERIALLGHSRRDGRAAGVARDELGQFLQRVHSVLPGVVEGSAAERRARAPATVDAGRRFAGRPTGAGPPGRRQTVSRASARGRNRGTAKTLHVAETSREDMRPRGHRWRDDSDALDAWKEGKTGYPIVDAGVRQLQREGYKHDRARLITASFLVHDLRIDWRAGAQHFFDWLVDGDLANNVGNWQWVAGTGANPRPGRAFNPLRQALRFDPAGEYVRRYVPELAGVEGRAVHEPWKLRETVSDYPAPIVERPR